MSRAFLNGITDPRSAGLGKVYTSDASGNGGWAAASAGSAPIKNSTTRSTGLTLTAATAIYVPDSVLAVPSGIAVGTSLCWDWFMQKTALGTGNFTITIFGGTNGTTADTALGTKVTTQSAAIDAAHCRATLTCTTAGASGVWEYSIAMVSYLTLSSGGTSGFGYGSGAAANVGVVAATGTFNTTTANLKFGVGLTSAVGAPVVTIYTLTALGLL